ncbi:MAG TPA: hypothetical protein IGS40_18905 [Trichormus sp. M33_DOE_039]|nr:hypothetical protein [Trichormus sp. M33_DOE_039]
MLPHLSSFTQQSELLEFAPEQALQRLIPQVLENAAYPCFVTLGRRKIEFSVSQEYKNWRCEAINNRLEFRKTLK